MLGLYMAFELRCRRIERLLMPGNCRHQRLNHLAILFSGIERTSRPDHVPR